MPLAWARSAPPIHSIQPSLAGAESQSYLSYVLAAKTNFSMERVPTTETEAMCPQQTASVTDIVTLPDTVDPGDFKWGRRLTHSSSKATMSGQSHCLQWLNPAQSHAIGVLGPSLFTTDPSGAEICQMLISPIHAEQMTLAMPMKAAAAL